MASSLAGPVSDSPLLPCLRAFVALVEATNRPRGDASWGVARLGAAPRLASPNTSACQGAVRTLRDLDVCARDRSMPSWLLAAVGWAVIPVCSGNIGSDSLAARPPYRRVGVLFSTTLSHCWRLRGCEIYIYVV